MNVDIKSKKPFFEISDEGIEIYTVMPSGGGKFILKGIEPLVDENGVFSNIIGVYTKEGQLDRKTKIFIRKYRKVFKFIWLTANGPYFEKRWKTLYRKYDGVTALDCNKYPVKKFRKNLELNYSMFARCGALENGFFWEPLNIKKDIDFSILTWYGDLEAKVWSDAYKVTLGLTEKGLKGILVTQRGNKETILEDDRINKLVQQGRLEVYEARFDTVEFHKLMSRAYVGIFPNQSDAFPKHIIESLLADKGVVISKKLLLGSITLKEMGYPNVFLQDFSDKNLISNLICFIDDFKNSNTSPREKWLERYNFDSLSQIWAEEINHLFGTSYKQIFLMRHINRFYKKI